MKTSFSITIIFLALFINFALPHEAEASVLVHRVNEAFRSIFDRNPNQAENKYWANRVIKGDKTTYKALQGAMAYHKAKDTSIGNTTTYRPLDQRINEAFRGIFRRTPTAVENNYWLSRVVNKDKTTYSALQDAMSYYKMLNKTMGNPVDRRPLKDRVNEAFRNVFKRNPDASENNYWLGRVIDGDKKTFSSLTGAMAFHHARGKTMGDPGKVAGLSLPKSGDDIDSLTKVVLPLFFQIYGSDPVSSEKDWWRRRIRCGELKSYSELVNSMAYHHANKARIGAPTICGNDAVNHVLENKVNGLDDNHPMGPHIRIGIFKSDGKAIHVTSDGQFQVRKGGYNILATLEPEEVAKVSWANGTYTAVTPKGTFTSDEKIRLVPLNMAVMELIGHQDNDTIVPYPGKQYNRFRGIIEIRRCDNCNELWAINELRMEYYVRGLAETSGNGPTEYLKALGVAARTYGLYHKIVTGSRQPRKGYDISNTPNDQLYRGYEYELLTNRMTGIFAETKGMVITDSRGENLRVPVYFSESDGKTRHFPDPAPRFSHLHHSVDDPHSNGRECGVGGNHCYGMSAQGAYGFASKDNWSWQRILKYFYKGVQIVKGY